MAGRHLLLEQRGVSNTTAARGLAIAGAFGVIVGVGLPTASAASEADQKAEALTPKAVELTAPVAAEESTSVAITSNAGGDWEMATVSIDAKEGRSEVQPQSPATQGAVFSGDVANEVKEGAAPAPAASTSGVVNIARQYAGVRYVSGGTTPAGWDCSGFTRYVFAQLGINLPRTSSAQRHAGVQVSAAQAQPGDLVWWPGHVGIYTGNGNHIAARNPKAGTYEGPVYGHPVYIRIG